MGRGGPLFFGVIAILEKIPKSVKPPWYFDDVYSVFGRIVFSFLFLAI